jgi:N-acetylglucosaminyl-diphospho-decaprenol L-rhamnosyltransferase
MSIGFVIVTYNSENVLRACLSSIPDGYEVIVIDNASNDNSVKLARSFGARVLVNEKNVGFGTACNRGAAILATSHVFFLNPDVVLTPGAIPEMEMAINLYPDAAGFGPAIEVPGKRRKFRSTSYPQYQGRLDKTESPPAGHGEVDFLDGAALVCNLEFFLKIGGFDEKIFLYYEDDDLCYRIRKHGNKLIYVASSAVCHERNGSSSGGMALEYLRSYHAAKSRMFLSRKYGLPLDLARERRHSFVRLLKSIAALNKTKIAKSLGALRAFGSGKFPNTGK